MAAHPTASLDEVGRSVKQLQLLVAVTSAAWGFTPKCLPRSSRPQWDTQPTAGLNKVGRNGSQPRCVPKSGRLQGYANQNAGRGNSDTVGSIPNCWPLSRRTPWEIRQNVWRSQVGCNGIYIQLLVDGPFVSGGPGHSGVMGLYIGVIGASRLLLLMPHYQPLPGGYCYGAFI